MAVITYNQAKQALAGGEIPAFLVLHGEDRYQAREMIRYLRSRLEARNSSGISPEMILNKVLFPQPLGPRIPINSCSTALRLIPPNVSSPPKVLLIPSTTISGNSYSSGKKSLVKALLASSGFSISF
jgi:hypothetical protein